MFFAALLPPLPGLGVVLLGTLQDNIVLQWAGVFVGALLAWGLGRVAAARLERTAPEVLQLMRAGRATSSTEADGGDGQTELTGKESPVGEQK